jgi:hypothetical protein
MRPILEFNDRLRSHRIHEMQFPFGIKKCSDRFLLLNYNYLFIFYTD